MTLTVCGGSWAQTLWLVEVYNNCSGWEATAAAWMTSQCPSFGGSCDLYVGSKHTEVQLVNHRSSSVAHTASASVQTLVLCTKVGQLWDKCTQTQWQNRSGDFMMCNRNYKDVDITCVKSLSALSNLPPVSSKATVALTQPTTPLGADLRHTSIHHRDGVATSQWQIFYPLFRWGENL